MLRKRQIILGLSLVFAVLFAQGQAVDVRAALDSNTLLIGAQTQLHLEVRKPKDLYVQFPIFQDTLSRTIEILTVSALDSTEEEGAILIRQSLLLTSFDSGYHLIPPFPFIVEGDAKDTFKTNTLGLEVLLVPIDTTQAIKPIKGPIQVPGSWWPVLYVLFGALVLLALFLYFRNRKVEEKEPEIVQILKQAPYQKALEALEATKKDRLWQSGAVKVYYSNITDILRVYIEEQFGVPAVEQISEEIISNLKSKQVLSVEQLEQLQALMGLSDLVKFAKGKPKPQENEQIMEKAIAFVEETAQLNKGIDKTINP